MNTAPIKWAQRDDFLYLTVNLHAVIDESISFTETDMEFKGVNSEGKHFEANIEFYQPIIPEESGYKVHPLGVEMIVKKSKDKRNDGKEGFWPHLLKDKHHGLDVTVDWNHYVDSDDDGEDDEHPFGWGF